MTVMDKAGDTGESEEGGDDGVTLEKDSEINAAISEESGDPASKSGTKDSEVQKDAPEDGSELPEEEAGGDEVKEPSLIESLQAKIAELEERIKPATPAEQPASAPQPLSEEEWSKFEEERGIPRTAQTWITQSMVRIVQDLTRKIDQRFAKFDRQDAMSSLAKDPEFQDANKYPKEVEQYLAKVDPRYHSDPQVLRDAIIWSRGMNYKNGVQKVRNEREINKRISGVARPSSSGGARPASKSSTQLTPIQKSAAAAVNMSEAEYSKLLGKGRIIGN